MPDEETNQFKIRLKNKQKFGQDSVGKVLDSVENFQDSVGNSDRQTQKHCRTLVSNICSKVFGRTLVRVSAALIPAAPRPGRLSRRHALELQPPANDQAAP
jgi:hypothetical protein